MGDYSLDDLNASRDVVWDYGLSADLAAMLDAAAVDAEGQVGSRNSRKTSCATHFAGYYARLWAFNVETANRDAVLLAGSLRNVAQGVRDLEADARAEQARIDAAREWKRQRDARSGLEKFGDTIDVLHLFHGDVVPPRADPVEQMHKTYDPPVQEARTPFEGSSSEGVSSAVPDDLRSFTSGERSANDVIRTTRSALVGLVEDFVSTCKWGSLDAGGVLDALGTYVASNDIDCVRLDAVAAAFEAAGGSGVVSTVANSAIAASVAACGVSEQRPELEVPTVQAIGSPPTSGHSNDPVNTATGDFVENEEDLRFWGRAPCWGGRVRIRR